MWPASPFRGIDAGAGLGEIVGALQGARGRPRLVGGWPRSVSENELGGLGV
jgi:hypothetical protein